MTKPTKPDTDQTDADATYIPEWEQFRDAMALTAPGALASREAPGATKRTSPDLWPTPAQREIMDKQSQLVTHLFAAMLYDGLGDRTGRRTEITAAVALIDALSIRRTSRSKEYSFFLLDDAAPFVMHMSRETNNHRADSNEQAIRAYARTVHARPVGRSVTTSAQLAGPDPKAGKS